MWICRFEIKNILLFHFRITVLWKFLNEFRLAKELDVTATIFSSYKLPLYNLNPWIVVYMNRYFMFIHLQFISAIFSSHVDILILIGSFSSNYFDEIEHVLNFSKFA